MTFHSWVSKRLITIIFLYVYRRNVASPCGVRVHVGSIRLANRGLGPLLRCSLKRPVPFQLLHGDAVARWLCACLYVVRAIVIETLPVGACQKWRLRSSSRDLVMSCPPLSFRDRSPPSGSYQSNLSR